jgi:hypothetical protein
VSATNSPHSYWRSNGDSALPCTVYVLSKPTSAISAAFAALKNQQLTCFQYALVVRFHSPPPRNPASIPAARTGYPAGV